MWFFKQKTAYEMRSRDWSSDVCSSDLKEAAERDADGQRLQSVDLKIEFDMIRVVLTADDFTRNPALGVCRRGIFSAATQIFGDFAGRGKGVSLIIPEPAREIFIAKLEHADRLIEIGRAHV